MTKAHLTAVKLALINHYFLPHFYQFLRFRTAGHAFNPPSHGLGTECGLRGASGGVLQLLSHIIVTNLIDSTSLAITDYNYTLLSTDVFYLSLNLRSILFSCFIISFHTNLETILF